MLTSTAWWWKSAALGLAGLALLLPLVWLLPAPMFRRSRRAVVMGASLFWPAFGVVLSQTMWDGYYRFFYPDWVKWAIPVLAFGVYPLLAFGYHWLASRLPGHPLFWFCLFAGVLAVVEHVAALYSWQFSERVPYLRDVPIASVLVFSFFEYQVYWAVALWLAWLLVRFAKHRSRAKSELEAIRVG